MRQLRYHWRYHTRHDHRYDCTAMDTAWALIRSTGKNRGDSSALLISRVIRYVQCRNAVNQQRTSITRSGDRLFQIFQTTQV
jgi:hypothetical protein